MVEPASAVVLRRLVATIAVVVACTLLPSFAVAQSFPGIAGASPAPSALSTLFDSTPITLDGAVLFRIAVPASGDGQQSIAVRANTVNVAIDQVLAVTERDGVSRTVFDPATFRIEVVRDRGQVYLEAIDAQHHDGFPIVTVTSADARYQQSTVEAVATQWQAILRSALVRAITIRQPEHQRKNLNEIAIIGGMLIVLTVLVSLLSSWLARRIAALDREAQEHQARLEAAQQAESQDESAPGATEHQERLVGLMLLARDPRRRISLFRALRLLLIIVTFLAWFIAIIHALLQFPQTTSAGRQLLHNGFAVAVIWAVALLVDRLLSIAVDRIPMLWELRAFGTAEDKQRQLLRAPTIARALAGLKSFVLFFVAGLATLTQLGIPVGSVVTIGSVAALAVSLAAQNLIRDVVSGFLVLIEDQFVVGDFVTINGNTGTVERLTLRMVQIRNATGSLVTISHSSATSVVNHSRNWSRVDYEISVDVASNVPFAIGLLQQQIADLESDPEWKDAIVEPAEWIGVDALSRDGAVVRARIKTAPLRQFALRRELNARVIKAFSAAKIGYGAPVPPPS